MRQNQKLSLFFFSFFLFHCTFSCLAQSKNLDTLKIAHKFFKQGNFFSKKNDLDSAYYYYNKALKIYSKKNDSLNKANVLYNISKIEYSVKSYGKSLSNVLEAINIYKLLGRKMLVSNCYNRLGLIERKQENFESSIRYHKKALLIRDSLGIDRLQITSLTNLGNVYKSQAKYSDAISYFNNALYFNSIASKSPKKYARLIDNKAYCNFKLNKETALNSFLKALEIRQNIKDVSGQIQSHFNLSDFYLDKGQSNTSREHLKQAYKLSKLIKENESILRAGLSLASIDTENASHYLAEYISINDSINNAEQQLKSEFSKVEFETKEIQQENKDLINSNSKKSIEIKAKEKKNQFFLLGLIASLITLIIIIWFYLRNKKQKKEIETLQKELHHRVKNNLSIIDTFIEIVKDEFENSKVDDKLTDLQNRIESMNEVHIQSYKSKDVTHVNLKDYIDTLVKNVKGSFLNPEIKVLKQIDKKLVIKTDKSFPLGLIINEFITNSFKHAFKNNTGEIKILFTELGKDIQLSISDNGNGIQENYDFNNSNTFGLRIMKLLSKQLKGSYDLKNSKEGVTLVVKFPK